MNALATLLREVKTDDVEPSRVMAWVFASGLGLGGHLSVGVALAPMRWEQQRLIRNLSDKLEMDPTRVAVKPVGRGMFDPGDVDFDFTEGKPKV